ncbi:hypothetical protein FACS189447_03590 [Spirochaetia bacterium]|nr:hypothetical protein FACS189447_03590 [Spirochaetia bacterium]
MSYTVQDDYYVFPVGSVYYVQFRDPLTRELLSKKSTGLKNKTLAKQWAQTEWDKRSANCKKSGVIFRNYAANFYIEGICPHELNRKAKGKRLGVSTRRNYRSDLEKYILTDPIADMGLDYIERADCIDFRDRLIKELGYTRNAQLVYQSFKNVLHTALDKGIMKTDPVHRLTIAWAKKGKRAATVSTNIIKLFDPKNWESANLRLAVMLAGITGLRAGEVRGIKWMDIDAAHDVIYVERQFNDFEGEKLPKWEKKRVTIYPAIMKSQLEPLRGKPDERVFSTYKSPRPQGGWGISGPISYKVLSKSLDKAIKKTNENILAEDPAGETIIRVTLHGLRHSIQTALLGAGVHPELLRATFGWTDEEVQEAYTHRELYDLTPQREVTDKLFGVMLGENKEVSHGKAPRIHKKSVRRRPRKYASR